uniref:Uncharacterized protein n=1 Tax=Arundo donax TaxID=35708 RepID=A0A0A9B3L4_ARUDO
MSDLLSKLLTWTIILLSTLHVISLMIISPHRCVICCLSKHQA